MRDFPVAKERVDYLNRDKIDSNNTLHTTFTELWSRQEIFIVYNLLKEIDEAYKVANSLKVTALIQSLDKILELKENNVHTFLTETSTVLD